MRTLALVIAFALAAGCGNDDGGGGGIPVTGLESAAIDAYCDLYVKCGLVDSVQTCRNLRLDVNIDPDVVAAVQAGTVTYHEDNARTCLDAFHTKSCDRNLFDSDRGLPAACSEMFTGTVAAGGACALNEECVSQDCSIPSCPMACCQGTCVGDTPPTRPALGESCATDSSCLDSFCDSTTEVCTAYLQEGAPCTSAGQCADGLACSSSSGTCEALAAEGAPCTATSDCALLGDVCDPSTRVCTAFALLGDACSTSAQCSPIYTCDAMTGACVLGPHEGQPCSGTCVDHSYCDAGTGTCTAPQADGASCQSASQCQSDHCDDTTMTCTTPPICI